MTIRTNDLMAVGMAITGRVRYWQGTPWCAVGPLARSLPVGDRRSTADAPAVQHSAGQTL